MKNSSKKENQAKDLVTSMILMLIGSPVATLLLYLFMLLLKHI